ncbi:hypothetical protein M0805_000173 [Coniferiporia weirii]|nr:hypothetical protein M0805_000173 [Coniferiporia weirii]
MSKIPRCRPPHSPRNAAFPRRVFSTSQSKPLHALDSGAAGSAASGPPLPSADDPFGSEWPPKRSKLSSITSNAGLATSNPAFPSLHQQATVPALHLKPVSHDPIPLEVQEDSKESTSPIPTPVVHLPLYSYKDFTPSPARVYVRHVDEADDLVEALSGPVGFDIEWRVIFRKTAPMRPTATVQLSDQRMILVIQELLEDPKICKLGVNILNDGIKLARDYNVRPQGLVELGGLARQADPGYVERYFRFCEPKHISSKTKVVSSGAVDTDPSAPPSAPAPKMRKPGYMISLATITAMYTERALAKGSVRTSNWEAQPLSDAQLEYAANDAHCAIMVYNKLTAMAKEAGVQLDPTKYTHGVRYSFGPSCWSRNTADPKQLSASRSTTGRTSTVPSSSSASTPTAVLSPVATSSSSSGTASLETATVVDISDSDIEILEINDVAKELGLDLKKLSPPAASRPDSSKKASSGQVHQRPQHIRAYNLWHYKRLPLNEMCAVLRSVENPLKVGTVISYVVGALTADPQLHFVYSHLAELLKTERASWTRHKDWFNALDASVYMNMNMEEV